MSDIETPLPWRTQSNTVNGNNSIQVSLILFDDYHLRTVSNAWHICMCLLCKGIHVSLWGIPLSRPTMHIRALENVLVITSTGAIEVGSHTINARIKRQFD